MFLTELQCRQAKVLKKAYAISDGGGLLLEMSPTGGKLWIARFWSKNGEERQVLGKYPDLSVREARIKNMEMRSVDLSMSNDLFGTIAEEWLEVQERDHLSEGYIRSIDFKLKKYIIPVLGKIPMSEISNSDISGLCEAIKASGFAEASRRVEDIIIRICRYAVSTGRIKHDPTSDKEYK